MSPVAGPEPTPLGPSGDTLPGFDFRATITPQSPVDPIAAVRLQVRRADDHEVLLGPTGFSATARWAPGECTIADPGQAVLPAKTALQWRVRTRSTLKVISPWSDWTDYTVTRGAPYVEPKPLGSATRLKGRHLKARVTVPVEAQFIANYEVELAPRADADSPVWDQPMWAETGGPLEATEPAKSSKKGLWFESLDGCPAKKGMTVNRRAPTVRLRSSKRIKAYRYRLEQFGHVFYKEKRATKGISDSGLSDDGLCLTFDLPRVFRRGALPDGFFFPPFAPKKGKYVGATYGPGVVASRPLGHSGFAVDFNHAGGEDGDPVLACANGRVLTVRKGPGSDGTVEITHDGGKYMTQYTHMKNIRVKEFAEDPKLGEVAVLQKIGEMDTMGTDATHLHHRHFQRKAGGGYKARQMSFGKRLVDVSISSGNGHSPQSLDDYEAHGWDRDPEAKITVEVRWGKKDWSNARSLRYSVRKAGAASTSCPDPGCGPPPSSAAIDHIYDGQEPPAGEYSVRYRCTDDTGVVSPWAYDDTVVVTA